MADRATPVLTGADSRAWRSYQGELGTADLAEMRIRDLSVPYPWLFDVTQVLPQGSPQDLRCVSDEWALRLIDRADDRGSLSSDDSLKWAAARLLPAGPKWRPALPELAADQVALELPGTGGLFAYRILGDAQGAVLQENFVIACGSWREVLFAGLVALELQVPSGVSLSIVLDEALASQKVRGRRYGLIVGGRDRHASVEASLQDLVVPQGQVVLV